MMNDSTKKTSEYFGSSLMIHNSPPFTSSLDSTELVWHDEFLDAPLFKVGCYNPFHTKSNNIGDENEGNLSFPPSFPFPITPLRRIHQMNAVNEQVMSTSPPNPLFRLLMQPHPKQRKCYKSENRYVLPNPLVICPVKSPLMIEGGKVSVKLVDNNGMSIANHLGVLDNSYDLEKTLDHNRLCLFTLKILGNSPPGNLFRLQFDVTYTTAERETFMETILSDPFVVMSNKSVRLKEPRIEDILPKFGSSHTVTELWIKGKDFSSRGVVVVVDGQTARVLHICPNLVSVLIPARKELVMDKGVEIVVMNKWRTKKSIASKSIQFTYLVDNA